MKIYGAGIAGLLAGNMFQNATIFEAGSEDQIQHKALLRFRSHAVGDAVGIDFKKVRVNKGIYYNNNYREPNIQLANMYSKKVIGKFADRSIWNLDPVDRFIAPEDFIQQLAERCKGRVVWNHTLNFTEVFGQTENAISTLPMSLIVKFKSQHTNKVDLFTPDFKAEPIIVKRWRIKNSDIFQTVYFPQDNTNLFRASITGDLLIAEYMVDAENKFSDEYSTNLIMNAFGIFDDSEIVEIEKVNQRFGKIAPIDDQWRKNFIHDLSMNHNIFSLGRFGTWRNILIDDVLKDIAVVKKLLTASNYERSKLNAK